MFFYSLINKILLKYLSGISLRRYWITFFINATIIKEAFGIHYEVGNSNFIKILYKGNFWYGLFLECNKWNDQIEKKANLLVIATV